MRSWDRCGFLTVFVVILMMAGIAANAGAGLRDRAAKAAEEAASGEVDDETPEQADDFLEDFALGDLVSIKNGDEVWIRMTPGQYRISKTTSRIKRRGKIRIVLRPRQVHALNEALGGGSGRKEVVLDVNAVDLRRSRLPKERVESHFIVEPISTFK